MFDLDQTLFDRQRAMDDWLDSFRLSNADRTYLSTLDQNGYGNRDDFFAAFESITGNVLDQSSFARSIVGFIQPDYALNRQIQELGKQYAIAILTNGGTCTQRAKINSLLLNEVFPQDRIFISEEIGVWKPDLRAFEFVAQSLKMPAKECLYLGDTIEIDMEPAWFAGWKAKQVRSRAEMMKIVMKLKERVAC